MKKLFYFIVIFVGITILFSSPFLRYPYDMIHHLIVIDDIYLQLANPMKKLVGIWTNDIYFMIPTGENTPIVLDRARFIWHYGWAELFVWLDIDSTQMLMRAKIIHVIQTFISLGSVYYFSHVVLRNVFKSIFIDALRWLSLWSVMIWLVIYATSSAAYHQVWMMWYSVNYQITLPLFWYMTALTLVLLLEETSVWKKLFFIVQILLLSRIILQIHSMEFLYYLMYMAIFGIIYIDKVYLFFKKYFYLFIPIVLGISYFIKNYQPEHSKIFEYLSWEKLPVLYEKIMYSGAILLRGYNRAFASINELMYVIAILSVPFIFYVLFQSYYKKQHTINLRMLLFIGLTSLFILIPLYQFAGGLFGMIAHTMVVNRLYYSASLFVVLPIIGYSFIQNYQIKLRYIHLFLALTLVLVYIFSKNSTMVNHNYYKNIQSIKNSFYERRVGFNLSQEQINTVGKLIKMYEQNNHTGKEIKFYARADIAFVIKYIYHKNVYWKGRRLDPDYIKNYKKSKNNQKQNSILFKIPKGFPSYSPYS